MFALVESGSITKYFNGNKGVTIDGTQHPKTIFTLWTEAERNAIGVYTVEIDESKKKNEEFVKDAFCGPGIVHIEDGEVISLYNEIPAGATLVKKEIDAEAFERWSLRAKAKWD